MDKVSNMSLMFSGCSSLTDLAALSRWNTNKVEDITAMFKNCYNLSDLSPLSNWNVGTVTKMGGLFSGCRSLIDLEPLKSWDIGNVTSLNSVFENCSNLTNIGGIGRWDTGKVHNMSNLFAQCSKLSDLSPLRGWDTANVNSTNRMFYHCSDLADLTPLSEWKTDKNTQMEYMFCGCSQISSLLPLTKWNTENVTNMRALFQLCKSLVNLEGIHDWNTHKVTNMNSIFSQCNSLEDINGLSKWNTNHLTDMGAMFSSCVNLKDSSPLGGWNTEKVTSMSAVFYGCENLVNLSGLKDWNTSSVTTMFNLFYGCKGLTDISSLKNWTTSNVKSMQCVFDGCSSLADLSALETWDTSQVTSMFGAFRGLKELTDLTPLSKWMRDEVREVTDMFGNCSSLTDLTPISNWNTSRISSFQSMFSNCVSLKDLSPLADWDTSGAIYMNHMFYGCRSLSRVTELADWNTNLVRNVGSLFGGCTSLEELDISGWTVNCPNSTNYGNMFSGDTKLARISLGENFSFIGINSMFPASPQNKRYTGLWCKEDSPEKGFTNWEIAEKYGTEQGETVGITPGTWVWQKAPEDYTIKFNANGAEGSMENVTGSIFEVTTLPESSFYLFDHEFTGWALSATPGESDRIYKPGESAILSDTAGTTITLYAQWQKNDNKATPEDGWYEFTLKGDEEAVFKNLPTESPYSVYEETPDGWVLVDSLGEQGTVKPNEEAIAAFRNQKAPDSVNVQLTASKLLNGKTPEGQTFRFELLENDTVLETVNSSADGTILFKQISYSEEGTHTYTIRETDLDTNVYESNSESFEVTVTVARNAESGKLEASVAYPEGGVVFHNTTIVHKGSLLVSKTVEGTKATDPDFTFRIHLSNADGSAYSGVAEGKFGDTLTSLKDGDTFTLKAGQSVLFTMPEGVSYSVKEINIPDGYAVTQDTFTGTIERDVEDEAKFTNTYTAEPVSVILHARKTLKGGDLNDDKYHFTFELLDSGNNVVSTAINTPDGSVLFNELKFDKSGDYAYTIREIMGELSEVIYDETSFSAVVQVTDPGNGKLTATVKYMKDDTVIGTPSFVNSIEPGYLSITKTVENKTKYVEDRKFTFTLFLKDKDGKALTGSYDWKSSTEGRSGSIKNGETLKLRDGETITIDKLPAGTQYSFAETSAEGFELTSNENTSGTILGGQTAEVSFVNTYQIKEKPLELQLSKTLTGAELKDGQFTFQLKDDSGNVIQEKTNKADGSIVFDPIAVSADSIGKTLKYTVTEVNDGQKFITFDDKTIEISVLVKDDGKGNMEFEITYPEKTVFENTYEYTASGKLDLKAKKVLKDGTLEDGQFFFELVDAKGKVIQEVSNNTQGDIIFESVSYTLENVGEHTYILREKKNPKLDNVVYDETEYEIKVTVSDNKDGTLKVTAEKKVKGKDDPVSELVFTNTWQEPVEMPSTGQPGIAQMTAAGLGIIAASALIIEERRKRRD